MREYNRGSVTQYRWLKNLPWMYYRGCETADRYRIDANNAILLIKENGDEMLPVHTLKIRVQKRTGIDGTANLLVIAWYPTFPYYHDFVYRNTRLFRLGGVFFAQKGHLLAGDCLSVFHRSYSQSITCVCNEGRALCPALIFLATSRDTTHRC
jgi:hypothetical protein